ncbi:MAG: YceI family protein, partial [Sulfurovum sp.]|nr:YceI family protein [Sulfurovum sp.]
LDYHYEKEEFKAQGNIDLLDFAAGQALASINKACYDLHKGKTWSDISIGFITHIKATLCNVEKK